MALPLLFALASAAPDILIDDANVVDVRSGRIQRSTDILIRADRIVEIGQISPRTGTRWVDGRGKYVIPGLWDMHVHWYDEPSLGLFTANGVTGARIMFGRQTHLDWKKRIANGDLVGPKLVVGSPIIDGPQPAWPGSIAVKAPTDAKDVVQKVATEGWEFGKVYTWMPRDTYFALADEFRKRGFPFEGHVAHSVSMIEASDAGHRCIEHVMDFYLALSSEGPALKKALDEASDEEWPKLFWKSLEKGANTYDPELAGKVYEAFRRNKTWHCPTLITSVSMSRLDGEEIHRDPRLRYLPSRWRTAWRPNNDNRLNGLSPESYAAMRGALVGAKRIIREMQKAGVGLLAGTDSGNPYCYPGFSIHEELALFVEAGLSPLEALRTATLNPAAYYGRTHELGSVAKGNLADLVLLDGNPLQDIGNTARVHAVLQDGRLFRRRDLDQLLAIAEAAATPAIEKG